MYQFDCVLESKKIIITPEIINNIPIKAGKSKFCLKKTYPTKVTSTIPIPDHIAYTIPMEMCLNTNDNKTKEIQKNIIDKKEGKI